jgi:hypothetical protein
VVEPVLRGDIVAGRKVRLRYLFGPGADDIGGDVAEVETGFRARHANNFERVAVVSEESWIKPALRALSFLMPGGARGFAVHDLPAAKTWLPEGLET